MPPRFTRSIRIDDPPLSGIQVSLRVFSCASELYFKYGFFFCLLAPKKKKGKQSEAEIFFSAKLLFLFLTSTSNFPFYFPFYFYLGPRALTQPLGNHSEPFGTIPILYNTFLCWRWIQKVLSRIPLCVIALRYISGRYLVVFGQQRKVASFEALNKSYLTLYEPFEMIRNHSEWLGNDSEPLKHIITWA
jgi:hypothetical protein